MSGKPTLNFYSTSDLRLVRQFSNYSRLQYGRALNELGELEVEIPTVMLSGMTISYGQILDVFMEYPGVAVFRDLNTLWAIVDWRENYFTPQNTIIKAWDLGSFLLSGRYVAYNANTSQTKKSARYDHMIRAIIRENFTAATDTNRNISTLSVQADVTPVTVTTAEKSFSRRRVDSVVREIVDASYASATSVFLIWDVLPNPDPSSWMFQLFYNYRGRDRRATRGVYPLQIGPLFGNLSGAFTEWDYTAYANFIYAAGQGQEADRQVSTAPTSLIPTGYARRELVYDSKLSVTTSLATEAFNQLMAQRPRLMAGGELQEKERFVRGIDFDYGDLVTITNPDLSFDALINSVVVQAEGGITRTRSGYRSLSLTV